MKSSDVAMRATVLLVDAEKDGEYNKLSIDDKWLVFKAAASVLENQAANGFWVAAMKENMLRITRGL